MNGDTLMLAFALMLIIEGIMPLLHPTLWRQTFERLLKFNDGQLRFVGLGSVLVGCLLFFLFK